MVAVLEVNKKIIMTNALRKSLTQKYGVSGTSPTEQATSSGNVLRQQLEEKYKPKATLNPVTIAGSGRNVYNAGPSVTPADTRSNREKVSLKYQDPTPNSRIGRERAAAADIVKKANEEKNGIIASPEYFARSVDVRSESGKFLKTFTGTENGEAKKKAEEYAIEKGGFIQVTPPAGFLGRIYTRAKEAFTGALDNYSRAGSEFLTDLGGTMPDPDGGPNRVPDPKAGPLRRTTSGIELGVAATEVLLSPISAVFSGAEEIPVAGKPVQGVNWIFGKVGEAGGWGADKVVDILPVSDDAKEEIRPAATELSTLLAQLALGKAGEKGYQRSAALREQIKTTITKDVIETNQLPRNVYISPEAVRSIFIDSSKFSAEEAAMIKDLGLDGKGYRDAIKNGLSIEIPSERIVTVADKPWFAKAKSIFGLEPESTRIVDTSGKPVQKTLIPEERRLGTGDTPNAKPGAVLPVETALNDVFTKPLTPSLLEKVNSLTPDEASAFGKKVIDSINESLGLKIDAEKASLPDNIKVIERESGDGRPAQFKNGEIEVFLPNLLKDIQTLAEGGQIRAHEGEFATVYQKRAGESIEDLSTRYVRDVILHEAGHQRTMTIEDTTKIQQLQSAINNAKLQQNNKALVDARKAMSEFQKTLEDKANAYLRSNREALEKEFFGGPRRNGQTTAKQRLINEKTGVKAKNEMVARSKQNLLIRRLKDTARGAKAGYAAGKRDASKNTKKQERSKKDIQLNEAQRKAQLQRLKQRILDRDRESKKIDDQRSIRERAREKVNDRNSTLEERRKAAADYAQILPFRDRGKFLKAIKNLKSEKEFLDVLDRISAASKASERRVLITEISKELKGTIVKKKNGIPNAKFELEAQRTLNKMRELQKTMSYQEAQMAITNKIASWQESNPDSAFPVELLHEVEILKTVGIKDQTLSELSDTLAAIQSLKETGRTKKELERFNRETEIQQKKDKIYDVITGKEPLPSENLSIRTREDKNGPLTNVKDFLTKYQYGWEEVLDALSVKDKSSLPYESYLSRFATEKTSKAFNDQNRGELTQIEGISKSMMEIYGLKKNTEVMKTIGSMKELVDLGDFKHADGKTRKLELTRGEAVQYYMWLQDETLLDTFAETLHWTPEIIDTVKNFLTPEDKKMGDWLIDEFYPTYYEGINAVYSKEYGVDLPFNRNYSPVHRDVDATIPENVLLAKESAKYATARNGSLKDRQNSRIDLKATDALENVTRHIAKMEHYKAWSETMFEFRRVFGDKQVRQAIKDIHGQGYLKVLDNFLNDFARDGVAREKIVKLVDGLRMNVTKALLGLNLNVGLKQLTGVLNYGIEIPAKDLFVGIADFWTNPLDKARFLHDKSATLQERFGDGFERDIKFTIEKGYDKKLANANNLSEILFIPIRNADKFTVYQGSWAVYRSEYARAKSQGKTDAQAEAAGIRAAEDITNRIQESSRLDTLSPIQRGGSIAKLFTMLAGQPNKYLRVMNNAGRNWKAGRQKGSVAAKRIIWAWFVVPFIYNLVADQLIDEEYRDSPGGLVTRTLLGPLSYPLIMGQLWQSIYGWTQGEPFSYQASPVESFGTDIQKAIQQFNAEDAVDGTAYIIDAAGKVGGVPTTLITRPVRDANRDNNSGGDETQGAVISN